jgi:predicted permease
MPQVFGNSNSLPISLVISLSKTLSGLHWDKIPNDNDNEVAARGILYLLIFQQLGQVVRWSWGYNVLLAPPKREDESPPPGSYRDDVSDDDADNLIDVSDDENDLERGKKGAANGHAKPNGTRTSSTSVSNSGTLTPGTYSPVAARGAVPGTVDGPGHLAAPHFDGGAVEDDLDDYRGDRHGGQDNEQLYEDASDVGEDESEGRGAWSRIKAFFRRLRLRLRDLIVRATKRTFSALPTVLQIGLRAAGRSLSRSWTTFLDVMNPPLWAMLCAIIIASVPKLQHLFYAPGTFINNSVSHAISQSGGVAVPLILFVLGGNLARNTLPKTPAEGAALDVEDPKEERNVLIAALVSRMLLPTIFMAPLLALTAKYVPVSILDDPIFVIVCFLLTGAPSALQLAQICQVNGVFMGAMSRLLFQSYVVW